MFKQIAEAIEYLHSVNVVHRDLKLDNILVEERSSTIRVIDFGFSIVCSPMSQRLKVFCGTPSYMAPEIVRKHDYEGPPVDMWALGVLLFVMLTGVFPFKGITESDLYSKIQRGSYRMPESLSKEAKRVIARLLETDPKKRITAKDLVKEPFLREAMAVTADPRTDSAAYE